MALDGGVREPDIRSQFTTREGTYKKMPNSEYCRPSRVPYTAQGPPSSFTPVKASFTDIEDEEETYTRIVFTIGRDLFYYNYEGVAQPVDLSKPLDKRTYKGVAPTCHDINRHTACVDSVRVAVGFAAGQVQIIDVGTKQSLQILNEERMVDKISTTCVQWVPGSDCLLISSHANGNMYTYDTSQDNINVVPQYHERPFKTSDSLTVYTLKNKTYTSPNGTPLGVLKNPLFKWVVTHESSAIHEFRFSPDGQHIAIVSQDGYLRVIEYSTFEMKGSMKSYFGGLLCCCWSPDGRYIVTGGEDDLVTVWSFYGGFVLARGHGHRSWVSNVAFDARCCVIPEEDEIISWYGGDSPALSHHDLKRSSKGQTTDDLRGSNISRMSTDSSNPKSTEHLRSSKKTAGSLHENLRSPVTELQDLARRQRTNSTVSRMSRISLAGSMEVAPRVCYRFGSVGQDAQLCLWELTDETLFQRRRTVTVLGSYGSVHSRGRGDTFCSHFLKSASNHVASPVNGCHTSKDNLLRDFHSDNGPEYLTHLSNDSKSGKRSKSSSTSNSTTPIKEHGITRGLHFFSLKDSSKAESNSVPSSGNTGKFATLGSNSDGHRKENTKEHKRNLSLPYFGSRNSNHSQSSSNGLTKNFHHNKKKQNVKTLGTSLCPRLEETPMLEPLVCKRITQGRLTCISFQKDSIVTVCQDGFIQTWARPQQHVMHHNPAMAGSPKSAHIMKSPTSDFRGTAPHASPTGTVV